MEHYLINLVGNLKKKNNCIQKCEYLFSAITQTEFSESQLFLCLVKIQVSLHICTVRSVFTTHTVIYCVFVPKAQTDQAAEMRRLIRVFTERSCYFQKLIWFVSLVPVKNCEILFLLYFAILWYNMFSSTFKNQSLFTKSRRALIWHIELLGKKEEWRNIFSHFFRKIGFDISRKLFSLETVRMKLSNPFLREKSENSY